METMLDRMGENPYNSSNVRIVAVVGIGSSSDPYSEKLNSGYTDALGYNKCLFSSTLDKSLKESMERMTHVRNS